MSNRIPTIPFDDATALYSTKARERLNSWKGRTNAGVSIDLRSQVYHRYPRERVIEMVEALLTVDGSLLAFEREQQKKIGPFSPTRPWSERRTIAIPDFWKRTTPKPNRKAWTVAANQLKSLIPPNSLVRLTVDEAIERLPKKAAAGLPYLGKFRDVLGSSRKRANQALGDPTSIKVEPSQAGRRGQSGGLRVEDVRDRLIWIMDKLDVIIAATYVQPILEVLRKRPSFAGWHGPAAVDAAVYGLLSAAEDRQIFSTDFESFDSTYSVELWNVVADAIDSWFVGGFPERDLITEGFITGDLLTPDGLLTHRPGGIASGGGFTSLAGTLGNWFCARYTTAVLGTELLAGMYLGDDAVNVWSRSPSVKEVTAAALDLGLVQHPDKQFVAEKELHYLQNYYSPDYIQGRSALGVRPLMRTLSPMLSYENFRNDDEWSKFLAATRTMAQLENNRNHPDGQKFVSLAMEGDETLRMYDPMEILRRAGGVDGATEQLGASHLLYTGKNLAGFEAFWVVGVIRQFA